jgi:two-component system chemotaxis response regulator CheY
MSKRILVVDDSSVMRRMIGDALEGQGHQIVGNAKNGREAIALYASLKPDLVTMDVTMRGMDGFSAAKEILQIDSRARIIFLSNLVDEQVRQEALSIGGKGFVNKTDAAKILECINCLEAEN